MSFDELQESVHNGRALPEGSSLALQGLWHDARGEWERAHQFAQEESGPDGSWVHAYLHRKEGDLGNAGYWYRRAGRSIPPADKPLEEEWAEIARALLATTDNGA
jgi:hypothetical protein